MVVFFSFPDTSLLQPNTLKKREKKKKALKNRNLGW
jgi:hypothetical protein